MESEKICRITFLVLILLQKARPGNLVVSSLFNAWLPRKRSLTNLELKAAGLLKYLLPFFGDHALKGFNHSK